MIFFRALILFNLFVQIQVVAQSIDKGNFEHLPELNSSLETLFYANQFDNIAKIWPVGKLALAIRYRHERHYDLVLLNERKLPVDSLRLLKLFRPEEELSDLSFISIQEGFVVNDEEIILVHNFGSTKLKLEPDSIIVLEKNMRNHVNPAFDYSLTFPAKNLFWNFNNDPLVFEKLIVETTQTVHELASLRRNRFGKRIHLRNYWDQTDFLEVPVKDYSLCHYFSIAGDKLLFSVPYQNNFILFEASSMKMYYLPVLDENTESWFVFYDNQKKAFFPVLRYRGMYIIHWFDISSGGLVPIAKCKQKPLAVHDNHIYIRREVSDNKIKYFEHHLLPLQKLISSF